MMQMQKLSPLYCTYNGVMLGIYMFLSRFEFAHDRYHVFQKRMQQFLFEIRAHFLIPTAHKRFKDKFTSLYSEILYMLTEKEGKSILLTCTHIFGERT